MFKKILLAVDGSAASKKAVAWAVQAQQESPDTYVQILYVHQPFLTPVAPGYVPSEYDYKEFLVQMPGETPAQSAFEQFQDQSNVHQKSVIGNPAACILDEASRGGYDAIVLGAEGHGVMSSVLIGSVSAKVLHHAACSVLIVR